jgi:hypothetical protein
MRQKHWTVVGVCVLVALTHLACESRHVGQDEQLVFTYDSPFEHETFNKPLVVGGRLELSVQELKQGDEDERAVSISSVKSSNPDVLAITGTVHDMFEVEARAPGSVTLTVEGVNEAGVPMKDRVTWRTDAMTRLDMAHACGDDPVAYMFAQNASFMVDVARYNARGERLSGFGHAPLVVVPEPAHVRHPVLSQASVEIITRGVKGEVTVSAKGSDQQLIMKRIGLGDITHIGTDFDPIARMLVGDKAQEVFVPFIGEHPVCEPTWPMTLVNKTPEVCHVMAGDEEGEGRAEGVVTLEAIRPGVCTYVVGVQGHEQLSRELSVAIGRLVFDGEELVKAASEDASPPRDTDSPVTPWWLSSLLALCIPGVLAPLWWMMMRGRGDTAGRRGR